MVSLVLRPEEAVLAIARVATPARPVFSSVIQKAIDGLDSNDFRKREGSGKFLAENADIVENEIKKALAANPGPESKRRLDEVIQQSKSLRVSASLQLWRCLEVLERIDTADARRIVRNIARGEPRARITREAAECLRRLEKKDVPKAN
jgi:hypothetical protein